MRAMRTLLLALFAWLALSASANAHEMSIAEMEVRETTPGDFMWQWTATSDRSIDDQGLNPVWPDACTAEANAVHCGAAGLQGTLHVDGVGKSYSAAMVKVFWRDGSSRVYTLTAAQPTVQLYGAADDPRGRGAIAAAYLVLGIEHILSGIDHLLFVVGLLFLVGFNKRLLWAITAFTAAHSITLASAALGWLTLRSPPVEACIALSIVLVVSEALRGSKSASASASPSPSPSPLPDSRQHDSIARRWPAAVAFVFGLVHGLGFAGALEEIGLPASHLPIALLTFNLGVEIGQLATIGAAWALTRWLSRYRAFDRLRTPALYVIGVLAAFWSWGRIMAIVG